eukprot:TRINITY_DN2994_c0_g1_i2.p1 TRINITY_DN2994_c0_g1~~TRINITY_DN2994_c0_g1_i2.p1  ORF type:complete len:187 (-),score=61.39 TRINITY_DN2994_c0_g1_i2:608-1168(-)
MEQHEKNFVQITNEKLDLAEIYALVKSPFAGAISTFSGTTRNHFQNKKVKRLEYESYAPMALKEMEKICLEIRKKWKVIGIAVYHRLGVVPIEEESVIICISSVHRKESLEAVHYAIDALKANVPIWKKELYEEEGHHHHEGEQKQSHDCCHAKWKGNEEYNALFLALTTKDNKDKDKEQEKEAET